MIIEVELSLCINLFVNAFIIKLTGLFLKERVRYWFFSALFGSVIALASPLLNLSIPVKFVLLLSEAFIMICFSFRFNSFRNFLMICLTFLLTTFIFGGGCYALQNLIGIYPLFVVVIVCSILYFCSRLIVRHQQKICIINNFTYKIRLKDNGNVIDEEGFLDSGNMLYDTITKKPVILINFDVFRKLYKDISYLAILTKTFNKGSIKNAHYIKINSVGSGTSLLVFTVDELCVGDEHSFKNVMIGLSFSGFEKSFGKNVLLHSELI